MSQHDADGTVVDSLLPRAANSTRRRQFSFWSQSAVRLGSVLFFVSAVLYNSRDVDGCPLRPARPISYM